MITNQGFSQSERWLEMLVPEYVQIDSRQLPDLLKFITEFASQINYYNSNNKPGGTWEDLFISDPYLLTLMVSRFDIMGNINLFNQYLNAVRVGIAGEERMESLKKLFSFLMKLKTQLSMLSDQFLQVYPSNRIEEVLASVPDTDTEMNDLLQFYNEAVDEFGYIFEYELQFPSIGLRKAVDKTKQSFFTGNTINERITNSLPPLIELFNRLNAKFNRLVETSQRYVARNKCTEQQFSPQTGLFIAFLELYTYLQKEINGINRRHLDFYFKDLLALKPYEGCPDQVHLIIESNQTQKRLQVTTADLLLAQIPGKDEPVHYALESDLLVTSAQIADIKTILISHFIQIVTNKPQRFDVVETQIYQASHPIFVPGQYQKNPALLTSWAAFGEDQHELAGNMRTMDDSNIGLIISSPLFYLPEGERTINLKIHFKPESFKSLVNYVHNFSELAGEGYETTIYSLLSNAFNIIYTSSESWGTVKSYSVKFEINETDKPKDKVLEIILQLKGSDPAFDIYRQHIHQLSIESALPLLHIGLNNYAEHHPFSFLKNTLIERITIKVDVKDFKSVKLQNNIGVLSPASPFQAFGPQPDLGSFLDIKNANLFNCFTKDFSLHLEWLNLPREKGGLTTYYTGYEAPFANNSFTVGISAINRGSYTPKPESQQQKELFAMQKGGDYMENCTSISDIDFNKIEFLNRPTLATEFSDTALREGGIRLELSNPPEAFGHRLFPQIFPEAVLKNAKKKGKKTPLPNQPLIPEIKSISVDYTLEYSENFNESSIATERNVELFHCYPFGFEYIYPGNDKKNIYFMPRFDDESNLLLGLKNAIPGTELSLLFQLDDNSFHHTIYEPNAIKWSYLENNNWVNFRRKELLFDSTNNFINSGIVKLRLPKELPTGNTIVDPGLFWIRASLVNNGERPHITGICTNGATAVRASGPVAEDELDLRLPAGTIKGFAHALKGVQQVWQLFPSFNGKPPEKSDKYYVRISERLRHKQRPVQARDIIQVVLEEFPQILMVKCFNTSAENFMIAPGSNLHIVLVPKEIKNSNVLSEPPRVSLAMLYKVKTFLSGIISPFINIEVGNPVYEKVKIICKVLLSAKASNNPGFYLRQLTTDINRYIAPWLFGEKEYLKIGNRIYRSDILLFIKTRPYVEYVSAFSAIHFSSSKNILTNEINAHITDTAVNELDYIASSSPTSVLIPSANHIITLLDMPVFEQAKPLGIGDFIIGEELLISDTVGQNIPTVKKTSDDSEDDDEYFSLIITHNI
ncbi:MAG: hypothetical protein Q8928_10710 [Bacteroidota bacterium]|nr:hypothetical protein [Bacteroidota bacterium]